jgi:signal transduction histidine kinase
MRKTKLQTLIWIATACIALFLLTGAYIAYRSMEGEIANQFNKQQEMLAKQAASGIEAHFQEILFTLKLGTSLENEGIGANSINLKTLYDRLNGKVISLVRVDESGIPKQAYPEEILEQVKNRNYHGVDYFRVCWITGQPYISKWLTDKTQPRKIIVAVPVFNREVRDGLPAFKGILLADVDPNIIIDTYIKPIKSGKSGFAWLIDSNGTLLYHPFHPDSKDSADRSYSENEDSCRGCHQSFDLETRMVTGEAGHTRLKTHTGQEYLIAYSPVHIDGAMWAAIGVNVPYSDVTNSVRRSFICIFILVIMTVAIIIIGAAAIIRLNNKRIRAEEVLASERLVTIGKMAAQVAHEIRNPLSSISLNAELLEDEINSYEGVSTEEARSLLTAIMSEVDRLASITEDYLKFARLPRPVWEKENINHILLDLLNFSKEEIAKHGIQVITQFDPSIPEIKVDEKQLREAFLNILKNAFEAMPQGGELQITTARTGEQIEVIISDTGIGIEEKNLEKIFTPFFTTKEEGTGLGLALTQQIIHEHGGTIQCKSQVGKGTTFILRFPGVGQRVKMDK